MSLYLLTLPVGGTMELSYRKWRVKEINRQWLDQAQSK
jgi:hypothetical protein